MQQETTTLPVLDYAQASKRCWTCWLNSVWFLLAPFVVAVAYVVFSRWPSRVFTTRSDYVFEGIACVSGAFFAAKLPLPLWLRLTLILVYGTALYFLMDRIFLYAVGYIHDDWL